MVQVDFEETLNRNKLVIKNNNLSSNIYVRTLFVLIVMTAIVVALKDTLHSTILLSVIVPFVLFTQGYIFYKKITDKKLFNITTPFALDTTKEIVKQYFDNEKWDIPFEEGNYLIATKDITLGGDSEKQATIIFNNGSLLLNVIHNNFYRANIPLLFDDTEVKKDIEWEISQWGKPKGVFLDLNNSKQDDC